MLKLLSLKAKAYKDFCKPFKPCHVGIHWIALTGYSRMSTHMSRFQSFVIHDVVGLLTSFYLFIDNFLKNPKLHERILPFVLHVNPLIVLIFNPPTPVDLIQIAISFYIQR